MRLIRYEGIYFLIIKNINVIIHYLFYNVKESNISIKFMYISSHIGIAGNEEIHQCVKSAMIISPLNAFSLNNIKNLLTQIKFSNWQKSWPTKSQNKFFQHKKFIKPRKHISHLNRKEETIITRLRISHTKLTHNHLFQKASKSSCQF